MQGNYSGGRSQGRGQNDCREDEQGYEQQQPRRCHRGDAVTAQCTNRN